ncbi:MAG: MBOAT family protein [Lachnospiraceae bacterium]|nr:MBOAT family protein [Lachnospiraceae bacterium]
MLFNSYIFILLFLPVTVTGYYLLNRAGIRAGELWLLAMSLWFYGYFNPWYLILICVSIAVNYTLGSVLNRLAPDTEKTALRKLLRLIAVLWNLGLFFHFKYYDFFAGSINAVFGTGFTLRHILMPLGISFYTLQQLSYVLDSYHGEAADITFTEYALFVTYFPQLVAGPIVLHNELIPQFRDPDKKRPDAGMISAGIMIFTLGLCKKILIADTLGKIVAWGYGATDIASAPDLIITVLAYTFQVYFDFSGYSDMAVGLGKMCNLTLPMNFNSPYKAVSVTDFWRRWHITLSRFMTKYVYVPLGGSKHGKTKTIINTIIVFTLSGLWHGANWTFILWGMMNGAGVCIWRFCASFFEKLPKAVQWLVTFVYIFFTMAMFRADSVTQALLIYRKILVPENLTLTEDMMSLVRIPYLRKALSMMHLPYSEMDVYIVSGVLALALLLFMCLKTENNYRRKVKLTGATCLMTVALLAFCVVSLGKVSVFLYFNF